MALAFNGKTVGTDDIKHPLIKDFNNKMDQLRKISSSWEFRYTPEKIHPRNPLDKDSREEKAASVLLPTTEQYVSDIVSGEVTYYKTKTFKGGQDTFSPKEIQFRGVKILNIDTDADLLYFLIFVSQHCTLLDFVEGQNKNRRRSHFTIYQHEKHVEKIAKIETAVAHVSRMIWDPEFGMQIEKLRTIASSLNIPNVHKMSDNDVRIALKTTVLDAPNGNYNVSMINSFLEAEDIDDKLRVKALIRQAKDGDALIAFSPSTKANKPGRWVYTTEGNPTLCEVGTPYDPTVTLVEHLLKNKHKLDELQEAVDKKMESMVAKT